MRDESTGSFPSTHWSVIAAGADGSVTIRREAIDRLFRDYRSALVRSLRWDCQRRGVDAEDLVQMFFVERVLEKDLLSRADPSRGRFRSFLQTCLRRFAADHFRRPSEKLHAATVPLLENDESDAAASTPDLFALEWSRDVARLALLRLSSRSESAESRTSWLLFRDHWLTPLVNTAPSPGLAVLGQQHGLPANAVYERVGRMRRQLVRAIREVIADYEGADDTRIDGELLDLRRSLAHPGTVTGMVKEWLSGDSAHREADSTVGIPLEQLDSGQLDQILKPSPDVLATEEDLRGILRQVLAQPVIVWLLPSDADSLPDDARRRNLGRWLGEVIDLDMLQAIKRSFRRLARGGDGRLPVEVCEAVYFCSIAAATVRCGQWISKSPVSVLADGFRRYAAASWLAESERTLLAQALTRAEGLA